MAFNFHIFSIICCALFLPDSRMTGCVFTCEDEALGVCGGPFHIGLNPLRLSLLWCGVRLHCGFGKA